MPYAQKTLDDLIQEIGVLLDDQSHVYWVEEEITLAIEEALYCWGALTSYWRSRGAFNVTVAHGSPYYFVDVELPLLRKRVYTLDRITKDIQYMCLEAANGITGTGMSGQISVTSILQAIARARNRFVLDAHLPISLHQNFVGIPPPDGLVDFPEASVFVHRVSWNDSGGAWTTLWRQDAWAFDHNDPTWPQNPTSPVAWSEAELSPLQLQLAPPPQNAGILEALTVDSVSLDLTDPATQLLLPDEWVHAVKYAALSDLFSAESQNTDPLRAQYAEQRYQQALKFAVDARSIIRLLSSAVPLPIDSMASLDAGAAYWRNQPGPPVLAGVAYDLVAIAPGVPDGTYGITADVVRSAPIPAAGGDFIQLGEEDLDNLIDYVTHVLTFKCGGKEFTQTFSGYDGFLQAIAARKGVNAAKITYLTPLLGQAQKEWQERPDRIPA